MQQWKPTATEQHNLPIQFHAVEGVKIEYNRNRELINLMHLLYKIIPSVWNHDENAELTIHIKTKFQDNNY